MSATLQKFHRGDIVQIAHDLGPSKAHFKKGIKAIVLGSYRDQYHGSPNKHNCTQFTLMFFDGNESSWYDECELTLINHDDGAPLIDKLRDQFDRVADLRAFWRPRWITALLKHNFHTPGAAASSRSA